MNSGKKLINSNLFLLMVILIIACFGICELPKFTVAIMIASALILWLMWGTNRLRFNDKSSDNTFKLKNEYIKTIVQIIGVFVLGVIYTSYDRDLKNQARADKLKEIVKAQLKDREFFDAHSNLKELYIEYEEKDWVLEKARILTRIACQFIVDSTTDSNYIKVFNFEKGPKKNIKEVIQFLCKISEDRDLNKKIRINLSNAFLEGSEFNKGNFSKAIFRNANLRHSKFNNTILDNANFESVYMPSVKFKGGVSLHNTRFTSGTDLYRSEFNDADLEHSIFFGAQLKNAKMNKVRNLKVNSLVQAIPWKIIDEKKRNIYDFDSLLKSIRWDNTQRG